MTEAIVVALITGGLSLLGVVITCMATARKNEKNTAVAQAVTDTKIEELTREVRTHNGFAEKIPVMQEQIKSIHRRLATLEQTEYSFIVRQSGSSRLRLPARGASLCPINRYFSTKGVSMKNLINNLAKLVKVKTVVTFAVMVVFTVLALQGAIEADNAMVIISMVVSFYFGTQHEKNG